MPAKAEYLSNGWVRFSKVLAAILGAYVATMFLHIAIAKNVANDAPIILTSTYTTFLVWCGLMIMVYMIRKAWVSWAILFSIILISGLLIFM